MAAAECFTQGHFAEGYLSTKTLDASRYDFLLAPQDSPPARDIEQAHQ